MITRRSFLSGAATAAVASRVLPGFAEPLGLPLGLQLIGRPFDEETLFALGETIEQSAGRMTLPEPWWA